MSDNEHPERPEHPDHPEHPEHPERNPEYWDRKIAKAFDKAFPPDPPPE